ncbi:dolichyl-P-Glc:Glc(2)Man(9)GlcNAc(2)-PP-dolichol alpha-1,2- glucosyltransferase KNAG_0A01600 [Huiozyma naganishii CBS 8797]|uniref:Dol-P-Glc:Glc(2)Man(9)GlcNAc(2)-PP-Dol alpha-1,2-glucosyltransferase n=1 Tax=Huiozyma naganishii (strain ATCC MYA-139 / BCRC 22969 / CBS 8797 / KCTC 17520 / NBRC 10181 / NCYC 3082 / Yp74L-3) TaxID=1071383 RepID=J7S1V6_HUIN7|nr:hypothetical protein KNAG_0A01600 [Kazachstania naganishii CBS 8797]CCK67849.1 hypothetical protein KNAG_0A01600 [Kazachstania naganishii CBS 8797]
MGSESSTGEQSQDGKPDVVEGADADLLSTQLIAPGIQRNIEDEVVMGFTINMLLYPVILVYFLVTFWYLTSRVVPYQFIDEKFHIGQTLTYLNGKWSQWDKKITTPPGLYLLGWANHHLLKPIFKSWSTLTILRLVNLFGGVVIFPWVVLRPLFLFNAIGFWPITLMCFPLLTTYYYLYYTDVWSTIFIVESLTLILTLPLGERKSIWASSLCAAISCLFRQTNIIWTGFIMVLAVERRAILTKKFNTHNVNNYLKAFIFAVEEFNHVVMPYALNFVLFFIYLIWNRSITLGDKSNHSVGLHFMQIFYLFLFIAAFSVPIWGSRNFLRSYKNRFLSKPIRTFFEIIGIMLIIRYFTKVHPFLLADNRHYTFYLFRKLLGHKRKLIKYWFMAPVYHFCTFIYLELMRPNEMVFHPVLPLPVRETIHLPLQLTHISWTALIVCTFATLIPSPLLEPRYYILPYLFWRIFITCNAEPIFEELVPAQNDEPPVTVSSTGRLLWEFLWFMGINVFTLLIFIRYTFSWSDEPFLQRIIW